MVGDVLERAAFLTRFHDVKLAEKRSRKQIDAGAVMATFIALLCMGKPDFECVRELQNDSDEDMIALYHAHGKCEQFHSEIKTDMGVERLPSGKFVTNKLVLELTVLAYNILRMIGQEAIRQGNAPEKQIVSRKRVRTVIQNLIHFAGHVTQHARQLLLSISRSNAWADCFLALASQFCLA